MEDFFPNNSAFCFEEFIKSSPLSVPYVVFLQVNLVIGLIGNLLTLLAIPYAAKKKKYLIKWI